MSRHNTVYCDVCGEPITDMGDHYTDDEVCQGGDGPGFFIHGKCYPHGMPLEQRRAVYEAGRLKVESAFEGPIEGITLQLVLPIKRVSDLLVSGLEGGRAWWMRLVKCENIFEGGVIELRSRTGAELTFESKVINLDTIGNAMSLFYEKEPRHFADWIAGRDDATTGDVFLQLCAFGEVVYG